MFSEIDCVRLQLGLCPARLLVLAKYSAKRDDIVSLTDMSAMERFELLEMLRTMRDYGRPVNRQYCAAMAS